MTISHDVNEIETVNAQQLQIRSTGTTVLQTSVFTTAYKISKARGHETKNFHRRKNRGDLLPMTPWLRFESEGSITSCGYDASYPGTFQTWTDYSFNDRWMLTEDDLLSYAGDAGVDPRDYVQVAAARIYSSGHDTLTFVAELRSVKRMFLNLAKRLVRMVKDPSYKNVKSVDDVANLYLEARYGWRPFINDLISLERTISSLDDSRKRFKERAGTSWATSVVHEVPWSYSSSKGTVVITDDVQVSFRGCVVADISPPDFAFNPIITGYELITFSFILDWFVNVGQWLSALSFLSMSKAHVASTGLLVEVSRTATVAGASPQNQYTSVNAHLTASSSAVLKTRSPSSVPMGITTITRLDIFKMVDLLSIIRALSR